METNLKKITSACKARGTMFTKDWDTLPLPCLPREGSHFLLNNQIKGPQYEVTNKKLE